MMLPPEEDVPDRDAQEQDEGADVFPAGPQGFEEMLHEELAALFAEEIGPDATNEALEQFAAYAGEVTREILPELVRIMTDAVLARAPEGVASAREERTAFRAAVRSMWGQALDSLELLVGVFYEAGRDAVMAAGRAGTLAADERLRMLFRLHARASRTAHEILALIEAGHADGALARCRTLHEIAVVASVLSTHDAVLAERYARHDAVRALETLKELKAHHEALGWEAPSEAELQAVAARVEALSMQYGPRFRHQYGWADGVIPSQVPGHKVGLHDLERAAELEHYRPFSSWASAAVHAGPQGFQSLGFPLAGGEFLYAAGSTSGLADPGQHAALSLGHIAGALALHVGTVDGAVQLGVIAELSERCQAAFVAAGDAVEAVTERNIAAEARGEPAPRSDSRPSVDDNANALARESHGDGEA